MIYLYHTQESVSACEESSLLSALPASRRTQIARRPCADRIASAAALLLLRYALCDAGYAAYADAPILWEGKPRFADPAIPVRFNFSHTVDKANGRFAAAVLLSDADAVGVDAEFVRPIHNRDALMRRLFSDAEREYVLSSGREDAFYQIWCAKEAYVKCTGEGFSHPLSQVTVDAAKSTAASGATVFDLAWFPFGDCRICCAADDLSGGVDAAEIPFEKILKSKLSIYTEDGTWNESSMSI